MRRLLLPVALFALLAAACHSDHPGEPTASDPTIVSSTITSDELPAEFDASRTYHYRQPSLSDPEGVLVALWHAGFPTTRAWQPLDDRCLDPVGPTFTIELVVDDPTIQERGFERGAGRLFCATTLIEYIVSEPGG